ncbi:MAG: hypothetical protein KJZ87_28845 [Thermoguttaceae bacterium]|nr:hypothetical protein [Thermoguttaceae bacterium]
MERSQSTTYVAAAIAFAVILGLSACRQESGDEPRGPQPPRGEPVARSAPSRDEPLLHPTGEDRHPTGDAEAVRPSAPENPIEVELTGPEELMVGEETQLELTITNRGAGVAKGLQLRQQSDWGLERVGESTSPLADLSPGESRKLPITVRPARAGSFTHSVEILDGSEVLASDWLGMAAVDPEPYEPPDPEQELTAAIAALGEPLVENAAALERLHPRYPIWFDKTERRVVMLGSVVQREVPLELFACMRGSKEHEAIVSIPVQAYLLHAGLLATGVEPGNPVRFSPEFVPASGPEIEVLVAFKDAAGQVQHARAQEWVRDMRTKKPMEEPWVFAGSQFLKNEETGQEYYQADNEGDLICVSNFPSAVLDVPVKSTDANASLLFEAFTERIPPRDTPVTLILTPRREPPAGGTAP